MKISSFCKQEGKEVSLLLDYKGWRNILQKNILILYFINKENYIMEQILRFLDNEFDSFKLKIPITSLRDFDNFIEIEKYKNCQTKYGCRETVYLSTSYYDRIDDFIKGCLYELSKSKDASAVKYVIDKIDNDINLDHFAINVNNYIKKHRECLKKNHKEAG